MLLAYIGPETVLPLSSGAAIIIGLVLAFGSRMLKLLRWTVSAGISLFRSQKLGGREESSEASVKHLQGTPVLAPAAQQSDEATPT
jgi:hypothetical protein